MTIKPSKELLVGAGEPVFLMREQRVAIADDINAASDLKIKIMGKDKAGRVINDDDERAKDKYVAKLMHGAGKNMASFSYYDDQKDAELTKVFFTRLETAASSFLTDLDIDLVRPTPSSVVKKLDQIYKTAEKLDKHLRDVDDRSRELLVEENVEIETILIHLDNLLLACEIQLNRKPSAKTHARTNLCLAVISALADLGLKVSTSRYGLVDSIVKRLAKASTGGKIIDIQDNIRAAMIIHRQLSK